LKFIKNSIEPAQYWCQEYNIGIIRSPIKWPFLFSIGNYLSLPVTMKAIYFIALGEIVKSMMGRMTCLHFKLS